jgi:hypothetical protein
MRACVLMQQEHELELERRSTKADRKDGNQNSIQNKSTKTGKRGIGGGAHQEDTCMVGEQEKVQAAHGREGTALPRTPRPTGTIQLI